ncbi:MAG: OmpA family protein [Bacteroidales bacterium]
MKKILTLVMMFAVVSIYAQQQEPKTDAKYTQYLTNGFWDNWFISVGGGAQVYFGEYDGDISLGDRLAPALDLSLGKWITPMFGVRAQFAGLSVKGATKYERGYFVEGANDACANCYTVKFNMFNLHGDFLWNVSNTLGGYKADRTWSFIPYLGLGYVRSWKKDVDPKYDEVGATVGLINKIRLSDAVDFNIELRSLLVNDRFDGYQVGQGIEELPAATIGFTYNFTKRGFSKYVKPVPPDYTPYTSKISDLEKKISESDAKTKRLADDLNAEKAKEPKIITNTEYLAGKMAVWFPLRGSKLTDKELINLGEYAEVVKKSGLKFTVIGSADKQTGSKKINQKLSEKRAQSVYDALVNKFGVDPGKLEIVANGDRDQRYKKAHLNRVVVIE